MHLIKFLIILLLTAFGGCIYKLEGKSVQFTTEEKSKNQISEDFQKNLDNVALDSAPNNSNIDLVGIWRGAISTNTIAKCNNIERSLLTTNEPMYCILAFESDGALHGFFYSKIIPIPKYLSFSIKWRLDGNKLFDPRYPDPDEAMTIKVLNTNSFQIEDSINCILYNIVFERLTVDQYTEVFTEAEESQQIKEKKTSCVYCGDNKAIICQYCNGGAVVEIPIDVSPPPNGTNATCSYCDGGKDKTCTYCNGTGKLQFDYLSPDVESPSKTSEKKTTCVYCNGEKTIKCETCKGEGKVLKFVETLKWNNATQKNETTTEIESRICQACKNGQVTCNKCNGKGDY